MLLNWLSLIAFVGSHAISIFNTVLMLWLGLTVLLTGDRRKPATIVGSAGLLLGAVFFGGHTLIISNTLVFDSAGVNVVWPIMWVIAVAAPFFWGLSIFYYSGNPTTGRWVRGILSTAAQSASRMLLSAPISRLALLQEMPTTAVAPPCRSLAEKPPARSASAFR